VKRRRGIFEQGVPGSRGFGHVVLGCLPRGEILDISKGTDGLGLGVRPEDVDPRDVTEAARIEDSSCGRSRRTGREIPALQGSKCERSASRVVD